MRRNMNANSNGSVTPQTECADCCGSNETDRYFFLVVFFAVWIIANGSLRPEYRNHTWEESGHVHTQGSMLHLRMSRLPRSVSDLPKTDRIEPEYVVQCVVQDLLGSTDGSEDGP